jgi:glycerate-2-kinase
MKEALGANSFRLMEKEARLILQEIYWSAVRAVQPHRLLSDQLRVSNSALVVRSRQTRQRIPLTGNVYVVGVGKGVDLTGAVWEKLFGRRLEEGMLLVRDRFYEGRSDRISILVGGHPLPDERGLIGTNRCLKLLERARRKDLVVFFLMGGASSLLIRPAAGLSLADKRAMTDVLLKSGMCIAEMNCVRKHLSSIKAGGILRAAYPAKIITLAISDVIGDDPTVIGSAPTFYDPTTFRDTWDVLEKYCLMKKTPKKVRDYLLRGVRGEIPETLKPGNRLSAQSLFFLLANNGDALRAAKSKAESLGFAATVLTTELSGDTQTRAEELCRLLKRSGNYRRPHCFLLGGETTVNVRGTGVGGRNQEFALVGAIELMGSPGLHLLSAGSDGSDGPTDAAGAFADGMTFSKARALGLDPYGALKNNDSYSLFKRLGNLFCPGPTGTNVLDFKIVLLY